MDEVDKSADRQFVRRLQRYFARNRSGQQRSYWIVPTPFFVASDMAHLIQAADLCIYCINWGFRIPSIGMTEDVRQEIVDEFRPWLDRLQFHGEGIRHGNLVWAHGVVYVDDPYGGSGGA